MLLRRTFGILFVGLVLVSVALGANADEANHQQGEPDSVIIPLDQIWAHMIPGTKDVHLLEPKHFGQAVLKIPGADLTALYNSSLSHQIFMAIASRSKEKQPIGSGFAVAGTGCEALTAVKEIMVQSQTPPQSFPIGTDITLFFFTRGLGTGFQLKEVRKSEEAVSIRYRFASYSAMDPIELLSTYYFALIPLGKLAAGKIAVNILEQPPEKYLEKNVRPYFRRRSEEMICKPFEFTVEPTIGAHRH